MNKSIIAQKIEEYLQKEILRILNKENDIPEKHTILGSDINEIRHIFYYLKANKVPLTIYYLIDTYTGFVIDIEDIYVKLQIVGFEESSFRRCRIAFNFLNIHYQFEVNIYKVEKDIVYLYLPLNIQFTSKRKFPRFFPENLFANINVIFNNLFSEKEYEQLLLQRYPKVIEEFSKDLPNLGIILRIILEELETISKDYYIKMINNDDIKKANWLIKQMLNLKKTIFIENTDELTSYYYSLPSTLITNLERLHKNMLKTNSEEDVLKYFENLQKKDIKEQRNSYIISPIFCFDKIIGYIYLETSYIERKKIFIEDAINISIIAKILSYTINRIVFYRTYYKEPRTQVRNISLSGILLKINSRTIYDFLIDNDLLKIELEIFNQQLSFIGIITRMFTLSENDYNIALEFYDFIGDSYKYLENYIFQLQKNPSKKGAVAP
ncbi:MAG: hypothetical protein KatS3mg129_1997 [Leptospiraceae bacterium]|nr:MAG: hypothetical protein KatS3mg129_1997 [Leptospiraceae bacterium]